MTNSDEEKAAKKYADEKWHEYKDIEIAKEAFLAGMTHRNNFYQMQMNEFHTMQLAGISTASMCNTETSMAKQRIGRENPYWTVAYEDVINAIQREIKLLKANDIMQKALSFYADPTVDVTVQIMVQPGKEDYWEIIDGGNRAIKALDEVSKLTAHKPDGGGK